MGEEEEGRAGSGLQEKSRTTNKSMAPMPQSTRQQATRLTGAIFRPEEADDASNDDSSLEDNGTVDADAMEDFFGEETPEETYWISDDQLKCFNVLVSMMVSRSLLP